MATRDHYLANMSGDMVRNRGLDDEDGYHDTLGIDIRAMAAASLAAKGSFRWYDMCCGRFHAGGDVSRATNGRAECVGVDIWTRLDGKEEVYKGAFIERANAATYQLPPDVDLVTCLKGLRYIKQIEGEKVMVSALERWLKALSKGSRLVAEVTDLSLPYEIPPYLSRVSPRPQFKRMKNGCVVLDITKK